MPITIGTTRGFGCIATISELGLVITKLKDSASVNANTWDPVTRSRLEFSIVPELFCPLAGFSAMADDFRLNFETLNIVVTDKNGTNYTPFKSPGATQPDLYVSGRFAEGIAQQLNTFFSPNRQMPSAGMFGSLSTGVKRGLPW